MKRIDIYIPEEDVFEITEILHKHEVGGISISDVDGSGKVPHEPVPEMVRSYMTGKHIVPAYVTRRKIETVVSDSKVNPIIDELLTVGPKRGKVFVHDVSEAYDLSKKISGENALC